MTANQQILNGLSFVREPSLGDAGVRGGVGNAIGKGIGYSVVGGGGGRRRNVYR